MSLPKFKYLAPKDMREALEILKEHKEQIAVCAGGSELVTHLKCGIKNPGYLLSLKNLDEMKVIQYNSKSGFILGAMISLTNIAINLTIKSELTAYAQAAEMIASPQIRNSATIGGNICLDTRCWHYNRSKQWRLASSPCYKIGGDLCYVVKGGKQCYALFQADTVPSLLILSAKLKLVQLSGERTIPIEEFHTGLGKSPNQLFPDEILTEIHIPKLAPYSGTAYIKYGKRPSFDFPALGIASLVKLDRNKKCCQEVKFALVGHDSKPLLIEATELLAGLDRPVLSEDQIDILLQKVKPIYHEGVSASLKRKIARVLVKKAFFESWEIACKDSINIH